MGYRKTTGRCPKCGGNLYLESDFNGWYEQCLQCGYLKDLAVVYEKKPMTVKPDIKPPVEAKKPAPKRKIAA